MSGGDSFDAYFSAPTCGLPYASWLQGDPLGTYGPMAVNISAQVALALASAGTVPAAEAGSVAVEAGEGDAFSLLGGGCFVAGTPVQMADGTTKPIEQIQAGDFVMSRGQDAGAAGAIESKRVLRAYHLAVRHTVLLTLSSGEVLETTENHPFFVSGSGWVKAGKLSIGNLLVPRAGPTASAVTVTGIERVAGPTIVYNLTVEDDHSYFVGTTAGGTWVHNGPGDCTAEEIAAVAGKWAQGTFNTVEESILYHFTQHGSGLTLSEYTEMATNLWEEGQGSAEWGIWKEGLQAAYRIYGIGNETGTYNAIGQILTYWRN